MPTNYSHQPPIYHRFPPVRPLENTADTQYREWLQDQLRDTLRLTLASFDADRPADATQALVCAMRLLAFEGKYPLEHTTDAYYFPLNRYRNILARLVSEDRSHAHIIGRFKEFGACLDVLFFAWKLLPGLTKKYFNAATTATAANQFYIGNYLDLVAALPITGAVQEAKQFLCAASPASGMDAPEDIYNKNAAALAFDYPTARKNLNKSWMCVVMWPLSEQTHRQMLIVLLETVLVHLDKPVLLTDFLMDSLDVGGPISLLALQGVFTLIQQHNLTYPNVYEKLYSMFEPEIFHTKFKARLFYLADIFLSSISLPEILVAAFVKRLARLALVAPPQDILIILYFIGNLIIRHPGLKRLMCHPTGGQVAADPFLMDERTPGKSHAMESSLWEVASLQQHALPTIAQAARFIQNPLPSVEWDLATVLELNEDDVSVYGGIVGDAIVF